MVVVGTIYDKDLKEKVFYIREVDSYTHSTSTSLNVEWSERVYTLTAVVSNIIGKGFVKFYKNGEEIGEQYVSKTATLIYPSTDAEAVFVARFMGNSDCLKSESPEVVSNLTTTVLTVTNNSTSASTIGDTVTVTCLLKTSDGTALNGVYVSDGTLTKLTDSNGKAVFEYVNFNAGSVNKTYVYKGNDDYTPSTGVTSWTVIKMNTILSASSDKSEYAVGNTATTTATLTDAKGNALSDMTVQCNGTNYTTDYDGKVTITTTCQSTGRIILDFYFDGTNDYTDSADTVMFYVVDKYDAGLSISTSKSSCYVGETVSVYVGLVSGDGSMITGASISDGSSTKTTDSTGVATFTYTNSTSGTVTKTYTFAGDSTYVSCNGSVTYTVNENLLQTTTTTVVANETNLPPSSVSIVTATVKDSTGNRVTSGNVQVITADPERVMQTTAVNGNGQVAFKITNLEGGKMSIYCKYVGNDYYSESTSDTVTITWSASYTNLVLSSDNLIGETGDNLSLKLASNLYSTEGFSVSLVDSDDGTMYATATTDYYGEASFSYPCTGLGDRNVCVQYKHIYSSEVTESNILTIEDCYIKGFNGSETWVLTCSRQNKPSVATGEDNELILTTTSSMGAYIDKSWTDTDAWIVEFDYKGTSQSNLGAIGISAKDRTHIERSCLRIKTQNGSAYYGLSANADDNFGSGTNIGSNTSYHHYKIINIGGTVSFYRDDTLITTKSDCAWASSEIVFFAHGWGSGQLYVKGFKAKHYSE